MLQFDANAHANVDAIVNWLKNKKAVYCSTMLQFDANTHANIDARVN